MRFELSTFWLVPVAALVAAPVGATTYFSVEQVHAELFPGEVLTPSPVELSDAQAKAIQETCGVRVREKNLRRWNSPNGGWLYVDQVLGKHEFITYALALDASGGVRGLEILDYRETYGDQVRHPRWRAQFNGKQHGAALKLEADIVNLSGATLSSLHLTEGIRRLLATHALIVGAP